MNRNTKKGWIKIYYTYKQNSYAKDYDYSLFTNVSTDFDNVKKTVKHFCDNFVGKGWLIIDRIETGACVENLLGKEEINYFVGKKYTFNN